MLYQMELQVIRVSDVISDVEQMLYHELLTIMALRFVGDNVLKINILM